MLLNIKLFGSRKKVALQIQKNLRDRDICCKFVTMNNVIKHINYLICRHECVVLPSIGAFISRWQPAFYDDKLELMYPPVKEVSFSAKINLSDGLLASSIARKENISFSRASKIVDDEIASMKHQLEVDGELSLGALGRLIYQPGSTPLFEANLEHSAINTMGFSPISVKSIIAKAREEAIVAGRIDHYHRGSRLRRMGLRAIKVAASIAIIAFATIMLLKPNTIDRNDNLASVAPSPSTFKSAQTATLPSINQAQILCIATPAETPIDMSSYYSASIEGYEDTPIAETSTTVSSTDTTSVQDNNEGMRLNSADRYCLVIASFPTQAQAQKFISSHSDMNLAILAKDGKHRVYAATGATSKEVANAKSLLNSNFADAWVCYMR